MSDLILQAQVSKKLDNFISNPSHALLFSGPNGTGKKALAAYLAAGLLGISAANILSHPQVTIIQPVEGKSIPIEAVRELEHVLSLKVPSRKAVSRIVFIYNAEKLGIEAQNAVLKNLEEPPAGTLFILTVDSEQHLLRTIRSRLQHIAVTAPSEKQLTDYFTSEGHQAKNIARAYALTGGLPSLMNALLNNEDHPLLPAVDTARELVSKSTYERLLLVDSLSKQKQLCRDTLFILQQMAHVSLSKATPASAKRWHRVLTASYQASESINMSAQPKLALMTLMVQM